VLRALAVAAVVALVALVALVAVSALPVTSPMRSAVIVPALKSPATFLKTIVAGELTEVALLLTVAVTAEEPSNELAATLIPLPDVAQAM